MEIMPIDRQDSWRPLSYLEQGFNINIVKSGERKPVELRIFGNGVHVSWGRRCRSGLTTDKAIALVQEWLGYEHLSFYPVYDESPD